MQFQTGDKVSHFKFGCGTITAIEAPDRIAVQFERYGSKLIAGAGYLRPENEMEQARRGRQGFAFDPDTFVYEDETAEHALGARWEPFFDSAEVVLKQLDTMLAASTVATGYGDSHFGPFNPPQAWPKAFVLAWPAPHDGVHFVVAVGEQGNDLVSFFPFTCEGSEHTAILDSVRVWPSGAEAQLELDWGPASITAFDAYYPINRGWYCAGRSYQFVLTGMAYEAKPADNTPMQIPIDTPGGRALALASGRIPGRNVEIGWDNAAMLLPCGGEDDDYSFRGPVKSVRDTRMFGKPAWLARTTLTRDIDAEGEDQDYDVDILITPKVWQGKTPPEPGMDIDGLLWLQAYLWMPGFSVRP